jgi:hypothetical protein
LSVLWTSIHRSCVSLPVSLPMALISPRINQQQQAVLQQKFPPPVESKPSPTAPPLDEWVRACARLSIAQPKASCYY